MSDQYTLPLSDPQAELAAVGGKGASLARMARAGLPVPDGFHVTTAAYRRFVDENDLQARILEALRAVDPNQPATLEAASAEAASAEAASAEAASAQIGALFAEGHVPADVAAAVETAYTALAAEDVSVPDESRSGLSKQPAKPVAVAVRSSATAEDLPDASFAGQQETFLNVGGTEAVLDAVKHCWASLWTARAIGYRARQNIGAEGLSLAVVVQTLVPADVAGILFTANPINGRRNEAVINAAWGLGEAVVGGEVTPDTYTVAKETGEMLERQIAEKQVMTVRVNGGTEEQPAPDEKRHQPALSDDAAVELTRLGVQIENHYGMGTSSRATPSPRVR